MISFLYTVLAISFFGFIAGMVGSRGNPKKRTARSIEKFKWLTAFFLIIMLACVVLIKILE